MRRLSQINIVGSRENGRGLDSLVIRKLKHDLDLLTPVDFCDLAQNNRQTHGVGRWSRRNKYAPAFRILVPSVNGEG